MEPSQHLHCQDPWQGGAGGAGGDTALPCSCRQLLRLSLPLPFLGKVKRWPSARPAVSHLPEREEGSPWSPIRSPAGHPPGEGGEGGDILADTPPPPPPSSELRRPRERAMATGGRAGVGFSCPGDTAGPAPPERGKSALGASGHPLQPATSSLGLAKTPRPKSSWLTSGPLQSCRGCFLGPGVWAPH